MYTSYLTALLSVLGFTYAPARAWDPDAGIVRSFTKRHGVHIHTTSNEEAAGHIIDGNDGTFWQSAACLPTGFMHRADLNVLLDCCTQTAVCLSTSSAEGLVNQRDVTDASFYTGHEVHASHGQAEFRIRFPSSKDMTSIHVRGMFHGPTSVRIVTSGTNRIIHILNPSDNYHFIRIDGPFTGVDEIVISSTQSFTMTEISALATIGCFQAATIDLGQPMDVGVFRTRHWAGGSKQDVLNTTLLTSINGHVWNVVASLDHSALGAVTTRLSEPMSVRYITVRHQMVNKDYKKSFLWEIDAWDSNGEWGAPPNASVHPLTLRQMFGVNGIWGWGHNEHSDGLSSNEGPFLYDQIASHGRNYHNMDWDVSDPDHVPNYDKMARGEGTEVQSWLNWDREYSTWVLANLSVDVSVQFHAKRFPMSNWSTPRQSAYNYGKAFAAHFGSSQGNGYVSAVEVGNEPWHYPAEFYTKVLDGMSSGVKSSNSAMKVLPGAMQAHNPNDETDVGGHYIGARVLDNMTDNIDVINAHYYSFYRREDGVRISVQPEHPDSEFNGVRNMMRWRDANMPNTSVWITEWGWDADGVGESCNFPECVSDAAQALYAIRGLLVLARCGVEKATWFFYANSDYCHTLFCRSGLTGSRNTGFLKKKVFETIASLFQLVGDKRFLSVILETKNAYAYLIGDDVLHPSHIVAWRPVDISDNSTVSVHIPSPTAGQHAWIIDGNGSPPRSVGVPGFNDGSLAAEISTSVLLIQI